jgi:hypothetical protein
MSGVSVSHPTRMPAAILGTKERLCRVIIVFSFRAPPDEASMR